MPGVAILHPVQEVPGKVGNASGQRKRGVYFFQRFAGGFFSDPDEGVRPAEISPVQVPHGGADDDIRVLKFGGLQRIGGDLAGPVQNVDEIGRASCRERVCYVV